MTTQSEQLKAIIEQSKKMVPTGLVHQADVDRYEALLKFTVSAGGYDGQDISTDYIDSFVSIEDALAANKKYGSDQPWSRIELRDGDFIYEIDPVRIMRRNPETGYFNPCADDGTVFVVQDEEDTREQSEIPLDEHFDLADALADLVDVHTENDIMLTLSGFPLRIVHAMAQAHHFNVDAHMQSCEELARDLDKDELRTTLITACKRFGIH